MYSYRGLPTTNDAWFIIAEYFEKKMLAGLGYRDDLNNISMFEVNCFVIIESEINKLKERDAKKRR